MVYVGVEIRRTTLESDADIQAELLTYTHQRRVLVIQSDDLSDLLNKGYDDLNSLTSEELLRFRVADGARLAGVAQVIHSRG